MIATRPHKVTLAAVGDVFFARGVAKQIEKHGAYYPFSKIAATFRKADIAFCNLECPLSKRGLPRHRRFLFRCDPNYAQVLKKTGFDVISLANNHTLDYGRDALMDTIRAVESAGMTPIGAGKGFDDSRRLRIVTKNGLRVGFLAFTDEPCVGVVPQPHAPGAAALDAHDLPRIVRKAKSRCDALVISFHWGVEYMKRPTERQRKVARACIDNGADLILGHHPHVLQPTETYKGKPIIYSMGGFVWDSRIFGSDKSAIYIVELGKSSARLLETIKVRIVKCRPEPERVPNRKVI